MRMLAVPLLLVTACSSGKPVVESPAAHDPTANTAPTGGVRAVDWANRTYDYQWRPFTSAMKASPRVTPYTLVEGRYDVEGDAPMQVWIGEPVYGDLTGDGVDEAVMVITEDGGDSLRYPLVLVFAADGTDAKQIGSIAVDEVAGEWNQVRELAVSDGSLQLTRLLPAKDFSNFREAAFAQRETWRWDGTQMVEDANARTIAPYDSLVQ